MINKCLSLKHEVQVHIKREAAESIFAPSKPLEQHSPKAEGPKEHSPMRQSSIIMQRQGENQLLYDRMHSSAKRIGNESSVFINQAFNSERSIGKRGEVNGSTTFINVKEHRMEEIAFRPMSQGG